ncbi:hypothetical protein GHK86_13450 [Acidimicrobiaceae bacterium USS-CC1]|uniref:Nucleotidyl transferase AbiEii/AbiGii toxin family protein n=1 Tax=Acidiferrimicrobium australe TaxID=2664430 RepID=A0ABW9QW95_9ACTN|nr:hypothetical protein [Acidiferrimicrobium australe]
MDTLQQRVAAVGLGALEPYGFALAGGYALQAHGLITRPSDDIDLFTDQWDTDRFTEAVQAATTAWEAEGMHVTVLRRAGTFARMALRHPSGSEVHVDLAADARRHAPATMSLGAVISETEAVGSKVAALFSRGEARDYLDVAGILASGRYRPTDLLRLGADADPGFRPAVLADALRAIDRYPDQEFTRYGLPSPDVTRLRSTMRRWAEQIDRQLSPPSQTASPSIPQRRAATPEPPQPPDPPGLSLG